MLSAVVILAGLATLWHKGSQAYGIDFSGGQIQEYRFAHPPAINKIRTLLKDLGLGEATIQQFKDNPNAVLIKTSADTNQVIADKLKEAFPGEDVQTLRIEHVGPVAGKHLQKKALYAIVWSLIGISCSESLGRF